MNFFLKIFKLLPPEIAHSASLISLKILHKTKLLKFFIKKNSKNENYNFEGMIFSNKLGTAAGLDKNGDFIDALGDLGFGFLEVGTITPYHKVVMLNQEFLETIKKNLLLIV